MQEQSSACVVTVGRIIEQKRVLSLAGIDIQQVEDKQGANDGTAQICVTIRFKAAGNHPKGSALLVTEYFPDDSDAMEFVLKIFDLLMDTGLAARADVVAWRRGLMVLV